MCPVRVHGVMPAVMLAVMLAVMPAVIPAVMPAPPHSQKEWELFDVALRCAGGCGAMYRILVVSPLFEGKSMVQQHRMVHDVLKADIAQMHGLTVSTKTPVQYKAAREKSAA